MDRPSPRVLTHSQLHVEQRDPQHHQHEQVWHQKGTWQEVMASQLTYFYGKGGFCPLIFNFCECHPVLALP